MNEQHDQIEALVNRALEFTPAERPAFLAGACGGNHTLREKVETLLRAAAEADGFMEGITALEQTPLSEGPGTVIGRYRLQQKIGEGGMGVVYMAEQTEPVTRKVALKIIKLGMDTKQVVARFEAERQALAMMDHPNIAKVLDAGATDSGRPYFVMELVRGVPITEYCDKNKLSTQERLALFIPVCQAIQHAHQKGVIHRDIKPTNVMVTLHDGNAVPKVIDFGIAKATNQKLTEKTLFTNYAQMIGTPAYMSPEQAEMSGLDVDTRTDVYSLGVLLYELLTGTTPFPSKELLSMGYGEMQKVIAEKEPPKPSTRLSTMENEERTVVAKNRSIEASALGRVFQGDLDWIVMKALEKDRTHRYETVNGLVSDVRRHLGNEPISAAAPTFRYQFQKFVRRNRRYARVAATVAVLLVVATAVATFQAVRATRASQLAEAARRAEERARTAELDARIQAQEKQKEAETAAAAQNRERMRAEGFLEQIQLQRANELLEGPEATLGITYLGQVLRSNPTNQVAAARLVSALIRPRSQSLIEPMRHDDGLFVVQFSPDGEKVVTASSDHTARVWNARTGQPLSPPMKHENRVGGAEFSPDGLRVVTASDDSTARIWDAQTGRPLTEPLTHQGEVWTAHFSTDGRRVLTASEDGTAQVWDAGTGKPVAKPMRHAAAVWCAAFSPDNLRVVTASRDKTARVWDAGTGQPLTGPMRHPAELDGNVGFSPDGLRLFTVCFDDHTVRLWDARTGQPLGEPMRHGEHVQNAEFSPDGLRLVTASQDNTARIWDGRTGRPLADPLQHPGMVLDAHFSPDGLRIVTGSHDGIARVWDARTGALLSELRLHTGVIISTGFSPDGDRVATASFDGTARVWDLRADLLPYLSLPQTGVIMTASFSPDGRRVATGTEDGTVRIWDASTSRPLTGPLVHGALIVSAMFSPDGTRVLTASWDETVRIWDVARGQPLTAPLRLKNQVMSAQFSPDGTRVVTASWDNTAQIWDASSGGKLTEPLQHDRPVLWAEFSPDGTRVVTASHDKTARIWDARTGQPLLEPLRHDGELFSAHFSPYGQRILTCSYDATARVWDAQTGQPITGLLRHQNEVRDGCFSADGLRVLTASQDKTARLWDARTGELLLPPMQHAEGVQSAHFSPDGRQIVTTSDEGRTTRVWDALTGEPLSDSMRETNGSWCGSASFSPDGQRVLTGTGRIWELFPSPVPVPDWFLDWTELWIARPFTQKTNSLAISEAERRTRMSELANRPDHDVYGRIARWIQADPRNRTISPFSSFTVAARIEQAIAVNTMESLSDVLLMRPTNSLAWARLALLQLDRETNQPAGALVEAEFSARRALHLDSSNGEAWLALGSVQLRAGSAVEAARSAERAVQLSPGQPGPWELLGDVHSRQQQWAEAFEAYRRGFAAVLETNLTGFQTRATLLRKQLEVLPRLDLASTTAASDREERLQQDFRQCLALGRGLRGERPKNIQPVWQTLADGCAAAGRKTELDLVVAAHLDGLREWVAEFPESSAVVQLAALEIWLGNEAQYLAARRRLLAQPDDAYGRGLIGVVVESAGLLPFSESAQADHLLRLAEELAARRPLIGKWAVIKAIVHFRCGQYEEAERILAEIGTGGDSTADTGDFFRAMSLFHLGRQDEAKDLFELTAGRMKALPANERNPLAGNATTEDLVLWLAYREARALLHLSSVKAQ